MDLQLEIAPFVLIEIEEAAALLEQRDPVFYLREEFARSWSRVWIAHLNQQVVGILIAWHVADELNVLDVVTRADFRRRGIGRALMQTAVTHAKANAVVLILLEVRRSNQAAIALYRSCGFFVTSVRARYYPNDEDAVEMALKLDQVTGAVVPHEDEVAGI